MASSHLRARHAMRRPPTRLIAARRQHELIRDEDAATHAFSLFTCHIVITCFIFFPLEISSSLGWEWFGSIDFYESNIRKNRWNKKG